MKDYRRLTEDEILQLKSQSCLADDWGNVSVAEGFNCEYEIGRASCRERV